MNTRFGDNQLRVRRYADIIKPQCGHDGLYDWNAFGRRGGLSCKYCEADNGQCQRGELYVNCLMTISGISAGTSRKAQKESVFQNIQRTLM